MQSEIARPSVAAWVSITKSTKINTDAVMAAQEVLDYYVKKEWSGAIPYAVQSYVISYAQNQRKQEPSKIEYYQRLRNPDHGETGIYRFSDC